MNLFPNINSGPQWRSIGSSRRLSRPLLRLRPGSRFAARSSDGRQCGLFVAISLPAQHRRQCHNGVCGQDSGTQDVSARRDDPGSARGVRVCRALSGTPRSAGQNGFGCLRRPAYRPIDDRSSAHPISSRLASRPCRRSAEQLIEAYNIARESWLIYRGAPSAIYMDQVTRNVSDLTRAVRAFETEAK